MNSDNGSEPKICRVMSRIWVKDMDFREFIPIQCNSNCQWCSTDGNQNYCKIDNLLNILDRISQHGRS